MEVEKSAARAAEIANELAVFSRQEKETRQGAAGKSERWWRTVAWIFSATRTARKSPGRCSWNSDLFGARFDEAKVQQALTKILENAVEAVGLSGSGQIAVHHAQCGFDGADAGPQRAARGGHLCLRGNRRQRQRASTPEVLPRIFEPFFTTKGQDASRPRPGAGLWHHHEPRRRRGGFQPAGRGHFRADLSAGGKKSGARQSGGANGT